MSHQEPIAVIGMACRAPGAKDVQEFWDMLISGREGISRAPQEAAPVGKDGLDYVPAAGFLDDVYSFDASFFGISPSEAVLMDLQIRIGLECAYSAFNDAALRPGKELGSVGTFVGASLGTYLLDHIANDFEGLTEHGGLRLLSATDRDHLAGQIAYRLDLRGPSIAVGTACSTSLVAIDAACKRLLGGDIDLALAGGVAVHFPLRRGYHHVPGSIYARSGRCAAFDANADGVVPGAGAAMVLLKRLEDAQRDGDPVHAVVLGSAVSGDGADKVGYSAPSVAGQTRTIQAAWQSAGVEPSSAGLIEGHGTGTLLGDAAEIAALHEALPGANCALGSVKSNIGHLDVAAGGISFIKVVQAIRNETIPTSLHVAEPRSDLETSTSKFHVPQEATDWKGAGRRVAGISAFGIGGTNAHAVLSNAPIVAPGMPESGQTVPLHLGAHDEDAMARLAGSILQYVRAKPNLRLVDLCLTLCVRSAGFRVRLSGLVDSLETLSNWLQKVVDGELVPQQEVSLEAALGTLGDLGARRISLPPYPFARTAYKLPDVSLRQPRTANARILDGQIARRCAEEDTAHRVPTIMRRPELQAALNCLCANVAYETLHRLVGTDEHGSFASAATIVSQVNADPDMVGLVQALRTMAMEADDEEARIGAGAAAQNIRDAFPEFTPMADLLLGRREELARSIMSAEAGKTILYGSEGASRLRTCFEEIGQVRETPFAVRAVADSVREYVQSSSTPVRILEVGAGTGMLTTALAETLASTDATLDVTDKSPLFVSQLDNMFAEQPHVSVGALDLTQELEIQGAAIGSYDLILALDVLHVLPDLAIGLKHLQALAKPQGQIIALESIQPNWWETIIWGLSQAWWSSGADPVCGPLRSLERWNTDIESVATGLRIKAAFPYSSAKGSDVGIISMLVEKNAGSSPSNWLYSQAWRRLAIRDSGPLSSDDRPLILLSPSTGLGRAFADSFAEVAEPALTCFAGKALDLSSSDRMTIRPDNPDDLKQALEKAGFGARSVRLVHMWTLDELNDAGDSQLRTLGYESLIAIAKGLSGIESAEETSVVFVTTGACDITGAEELCSAVRLADGPVQLFEREMPGMKANRLDLNLSEPTFAVRPAIDMILGLSAGKNAKEPLLAMRGCHVWTETSEAHPATPKADPSQFISAGSSILVIGGLGAIGSALAQTFINVPDVQIILASRGAPSVNNLGGKGVLDQAHSKGYVTQAQRDRILPLIEAGVTVQLETLDLSDKSGLRQLCNRAKDRGYPVRGLVHAAGRPDLGGVMLRRSQEASDEVLLSKTLGMTSISESFGPDDLELAVFCGSIGTMLPNLKFGEVGYLAANAHLVAAAEKLSRTCNGKVLALRWTDWQESGMWKEAQANIANAYRRSDDTLPLMPDILRAITVSEGQEAFLRALVIPGANVVTVCSEPLPEILARHAAFSAKEHAQFLEKRGLVRAKTSQEQDAVRVQSDAEESLEVRLAAMWQELLGVDHVGLDDDFFDLGGDSLLGIRVLNRLRVDFHVSDTLAGLVTAPTVRQLAERVRTLQPSEDDAGESEEFDEVRL